MAAKPIYIWSGSEWIELGASPGDNGQGIPTGGTDGQFLAKKTNTNYDTEWKTITTANGIVQLTDSISSTSTTTAATPNSIKTLSDTILLDSIVDAKGDLLVGTAADTVNKLTVGTDGRILVADSTASEGVSWFQPPLVHTSGNYYSWWLNSGSGFVTGLGDMYLTPFRVVKTTTYTKIAVRITTGASTGRAARLGIYTSSSGLPNSLVVDAGAVSGATTGSKSITINETLTPGIYWLAAAMQGPSGGLTFRSASGANGCVGPYVVAGPLSTGVNQNPISGFYIAGTVTGALPSTVSSPALSSNTVSVFLGV